MPATFLSFDEGGYWHTFRFAAVVEGGAGAGYLLLSVFESDYNPAERWW